MFLQTARSRGGFNGSLFPVLPPQPALREAAGHPAWGTGSRAVRFRGWGLRLHGTFQLREGIGCPRGSSSEQYEPSPSVALTLKPNKGQYSVCRCHRATGSGGEGAAPAWICGMARAAMAGRQGMPLAMGAAAARRAQRRHTGSGAGLGVLCLGLGTGGTAQLLLQPLGSGWQCHELQRGNCGVQSQTQGAWGCLYLTALCLRDRKRP